MNKTLKTLTVIALIALGSITTNAQAIDEKRMDRDLKVAANILSTLSGEESRRLWSDDNDESSYIPDFGVILTVPTRSVMFLEGKGQIISSGRNSLVFIDEDDDSDVKIKVKGETKVLEGNSEEAQEIKHQITSELKDQITTFLADYADLIGQLKPSDRIVVQMKNRNQYEYYLGGSGKKSSGNLMAEVKKSDLTAQRQGKISRDELISRISFTGNEKKEVAKDIELFSTIFSRLYEPDLSTTYYLSTRNIAYSMLEGLGVTFSLKFYSSSSENGIHKIRTTGEGGLTQEERNEIVNAMYPDFEQSFKQNLLDYGRTVKSLEPDEKLIFKVRLTECKGCEMPKEIEVVVNGKTLSSYDKGSLSREKAMGMIEIKRKEN